MSNDMVFRCQDAAVHNAMAAACPYRVQRTIFPYVPQKKPDWVYRLERQVADPDRNGPPRKGTANNVLSEEGIENTAAWMVTLSQKELGDFMTLLANWREHFLSDIMQIYFELRRSHDRSLDQKMRVKGVRCTKPLRRRPYYLPQVLGPVEEPKMGKTLAVTPNGIILG